MILALDDPKTDAGRREIPLTRLEGAALEVQRELVERLRLVAGDRWAERGLVFPNTRGGPLREDHVLTAWHDMLKSAGLEGDDVPPLRMHDLRHSTGTLMADHGEDLVVIQRTLGHANPNITAGIYIGRVPKALRNAAERFAALLELEAEAVPEPPP